MFFKPILYLISFFTISLFVCNKSIAQQYGIKNFIPFENTSEKTHPILTIKTTLHIVYRTKNEPNNITSDSIDFIHQQFDWINNSYKNMAKPTLLPKDGKTYFVPDSRIRFRLDTIIYHIDSLAWDRIFVGVAMTGGAPWKIDSVDLMKNQLKIKGRWENVLRSKGDSLKIGGSSGNDGIYHPISYYSNSTHTYIIFKEPLSIDIPDGHITYFRNIDKNCHKDNWEKIAHSDKNSIHVFYTGSSAEKPAFGCGPSPYYLNLSRIHLNGAFASAQLTAHELGHCLGLRHTNVPQFNDLPPSDKFGWIPCNKTNTSNNIMGYNHCRNYLSPKQIGYIHQRYTTDTNLIKLTANGEYDNAKSVSIWKDEVWKKAMVVSGDIIVRAGSTLTILKMVSMAQNSKIYLERNSKLIVDGAVITNNHDKNWGGVVLCKSYLRKNKKPCRKINYGEIELLNGAKIIN